MKLYSGAALAGVAMTAAAILAAPACFGQDAKPAQDQSQPQDQQQTQAAPNRLKRKPDMHRFTIGAAGRYIVNGTLQGNGYTSELTNPSRLVDYNSSATPVKYSVGAVVEIRLNSHFSVVAEGMYHPVKYRLVTTTTYQTPVPRGVLLTVEQEDTKSRVFDIPVMVKFRKFTATGPLSHAFVEGGGALRLLTNVRSGTTLTYSDASTKTNQTSAYPIKQRVTGLTAGAGLTFTDELGIHVTPEARYTYWMDTNYKLPGIGFPKSQMEVGLSFSF